MKSTDDIPGPPETAIAAPYPGLRPFERAEAPYFFGRHRQISALLRRLQKKHLVAVVGPSGSGKSSLVRAGLIPTLELGFPTPVGDAWRAAEMTPGSSPLRRLASALWRASVAGRQPEAPPTASDVTMPSSAERDRALIQATLRGGPRGIVDLYRQGVLDAGENLLLLVDQFEEIFRFRREKDRGDEAEAFVAQLLETSRETRWPIYIVLTMRFDFLRDCAVFDGLPEALNETQYLVPRLSYDELLEAITKPAAAWTERPRSRVTPKLANRLINDLGQEVDQLPLLQHFLRRLWMLEAERSKSAAAPLMLDADDADTLLRLDVEPGLSRLGQVLSDHADEALGELTGNLPRVACRAFRVLTERGSGARDIRRPLTVATVADTVGQKPETVQAAMQPFIDRDFIRLDPDGELNIAHETLIWHWQQLQKWVRDEANSLVIYRRLRESARLYGEKRGSLLQYPELGEVLFWRDSERPTPAWAALYLDPEKKRPGDPEHNLEVAAKELDEAMSFLNKSRLRWDLRKALVRAVPIVAILLTLAAVLNIRDIRRQTREAQEQAATATAEMKDARQAAELAESLAREASAAEKRARTILADMEEEIAAANEELERVRARSASEIDKAIAERNRADKATEEAKQARQDADRAFGTSVEARQLAEVVQEKNREVEDSLRQRFEQQLRSASAFMRGGDPYQARAILEQIAADQEIVTMSRRRVLQAMKGLIELISSVPLWSYDAGPWAEKLALDPSGPLTAVGGSMAGGATPAGKLEMLELTRERSSSTILPATVRGLAYDADDVLWLSDAEGVIHRFDRATDQRPDAVFRAGETSFAIALAPEKGFGPLYDGAFLANAGAVVRLVDLESGKVLRELERKLWSQLVQKLKGKKFIDVAFQQVPTKGHGPLVAAAAEDHLITWELEERLRVDDKDHYGDLHTAVAFHPDKPHLAAAGPNREAVLVLDPTTGLTTSQRRIVFQHPRRVTDLIFLDDGRRLATAAEDGRVRIWTWNETAGVGQLLRVLEPRGGGAALRQLEVDDGGFIHSLDANGTLQLYDSGDKPTIIEPREPLGTVAQVVLSPDLDRVAVTEVSTGTPSKSSKDGAATHRARVHLFDRTSRVQWDLTLAERPSDGEPPPRIFFAGDELRVATPTKAMALTVHWTTSQLIPADAINVRKGQRAEKVLRNGTILSATVDGAGSVHIWRQEKPGQPPSRVLVEKLRGSITELHFSDDGRRLLVQLGGRSSTGAELRMVSLDPSGGSRGSTILHEQRLLGDQISAISPTGRRVVLAAPLSLDTTCQGACLSVVTLEAEALKVADQTTLKIEHPVPPVASSVVGTPPDLLLDIDFGPDDNLLAMLSRDGYLRLWDLDGGSELFALQVPVAAVPGQSGAIDFACTRLSVDPVSVDCTIAVVLPPDRLVVYDLGSFELDG